MRDFLLFRRMLTPIILQFLFWVGVIITVVGGLIDIYNHLVWHGLQILILGPIIIRVACELLILFFRMNETLTDIKNAVQEKL